MAKRIKEKEATAIINSLSSGVVPRIGVQHITVGRKLEIEAFTSSLDDVKAGHSMMKFWIGDFGSGKSFILHLLNTVATKQKFVVSNADFTPENRLYSNDFKAVVLYSAIMENVAIQTKPEGGALPTLLDKWIENVISETSQEYNITYSEITAPENASKIETKIIETVKELTETGGYDFGVVIHKYYLGFINDDDQLKRNSLKWLKGEYRTKTEAKSELGVRNIITDTNYYDMLKNFCKLFVSIGYSGFMINLDEAINLYKISTSTVREKNYEKILTIYNDCFQGKVSNLFFNIAGTKEFLSNPRRGLFSYDALKTRLETNKFETSEYRDFTQPVIKLAPLDHAEIFVLLKNLKEIFNLNYKSSVEITDVEIQNFMEELFNKPGADEFLTPREVIRDFLNILSIIRQNPEIDKSRIINDITVKDERPLDLDAIEEI